MLSKCHSKLSPELAKSPVLQAQVDAGDGTVTQLLEGFVTTGTQDFPDPAHRGHPHWRLRYRPRRNANRLEFEPLNVSGVEFEIRLPTAHKRLDTTEADIDLEPIEAGVEGMEKQ
ncbi:MAG: hypothetical protein U5K33_01105 [Halofilum sp. (in: g-proteobacteria)]|nr:hypothetical protein [Halofilum sp. (in: g-proteobacteria)]